MMQYYMTELRVTDLPRSIDWYCDTLALQLSLHDEANGFALLDDQQAARLALKQSQHPSTNVVIHWQVQNLDAIVNTLSQQGIATSIKDSTEGYRAITIDDPDGISITFFEWV